MEQISVRSVGRFLKGGCPSGSYWLNANPDDPVGAQVKVVWFEQAPVLSTQGIHVISGR